jgi:RTX calcium-binding nonapeptide repeat (4 copies)
VTVFDDAPVKITPDDLLIENKGASGTGDEVTSSLNFVTGADGLGSVIFNALDIDARSTVTAPLIPGDTSSLIKAQDAEGRDLTLGGQQLYLYLNSSSTVLTASVGTSSGGLVGYTVTLNGAGGTYTFNPEAAISNGTEVTSTNLSSVGGGNPTFKLLMNVGGTLQDVAMTTATGNTVNTDKDDIGVNQGQTFSAGEILRSDLVNGLTLHTATGGAPDTFSYDGTHNEVIRWKQQIQITGNSGENADFKVTAINAGPVIGPDDSTFYDPSFSGDAPVNLTLSNVRIYNANNQLVTDYAANGITITAGNDSSTIDPAIYIYGLKDDWHYEIVTDDGTKFDAIQVEALAGTDTFSLGFFTYGTDSAGAPIELSYNIVGTDSDGDSVNGTVDVTLYPDAVASSGNSAGTSGTDILLGTNNADIISGAGGDDTIAGNAGNDILTGGADNDVLIGGSGVDTFRWISATEGADTLKDIAIGNRYSGQGTLDPNADLLNLTDVFAGNPTVLATLQSLVNSDSSDVGQYIKFELSGPNLDGTKTATLKVDTDGILTGASDVTLATFTVAGSTTDGSALLSQLLTNDQIVV